MKRFIISVLLALSYCTPTLAPAAPPAGYDPHGELAKWYRSLERPDKPQNGEWPCCDLSDCRPVDFTGTSPEERSANEGAVYKALLTPENFPIAEPIWVVIPNEKVLHRPDNPVGKAVVCWMPSMGVLCFTLPAMI